MSNEETKKAEVNVVAALIWRGDRFLICHRTTKKNHGNKWEFVGGKIEKGETKSEALKRECYEELKIVIEPQEIFAEASYEYTDMKVNITVIQATIVSGEPQKTEHDDVQWIRACDIPKYDFSDADRTIVEKIKELYGNC